MIRIPRGARSALVALALGGIALAGPVGCLGSAPPPEMRYFRLPLWEGVRSAGTDKLPVVIQVESLDVLPDYDRVRIVYRVSPEQLRHYRYRQWVVKPGRLFRESLERFLMATGRFRGVTSQSQPIPTYVLRGRVLSIEQVEEGTHREKWFAHANVELHLVRASDGKRIWSLHIVTKSRVRKRTPQQIVRTLTRDLRTHLLKQLPGLVSAIRQDQAAR